MPGKAAVASAKAGVASSAEAAMASSTTAVTSTAMLGTKRYCGCQKEGRREDQEATHGAIIRPFWPVRVVP